MFAVCKDLNARKYVSTLLKIITPLFKGVSKTAQAFMDQHAQYSGFRGLSKRTVEEVAVVIGFNDFS